MGITKKRSLLSTAQYVPQKAEDDWYGRFKRTYHRKKNKKFQCEKFVCENLVSGAKTTGIRFSSGKSKLIKIHTNELSKDIEHLILKFIIYIISFC